MVNPFKFYTSRTPAVLTRVEPEHKKQNVSIFDYFTVKPRKKGSSRRSKAPFPDSSINISFIQRECNAFHLPSKIHQFTL